MGIEWKRSKNFIIDRLPILISFYLFAPSSLPYGDKSGLGNLLKEAFSWYSFKTVIPFVLLGFIGAGSI
jgi:hypothetical protein